MTPTPEQVQAWAREAWKGRTTHEAWFTDSLPAFQRFADLVLKRDTDKIMALADEYAIRYNAAISALSLTEGIPLLERNADARASLLAALKEPR